MLAEKFKLVDASGNQVAELLLNEEAEGWFSGKMISEQLPPRLRKALEWYDEVVENQMLSFLDAAMASVEEFGLSVRTRQGPPRKVYSLQLNKENEVSFRTSPVPPPAWLTKSESA